MKKHSGTIYTIGHSTHPIQEFTAMLDSFDIQKLIDVRTIPKSRHNPQFNTDKLSASLKRHGIRYLHMPGLGGLRRPSKDSVNAGWRNASFRGYADYMQTPEFQSNLEELIADSGGTRLAIMCAEAVPWRCHRSLIADALTVRGFEVRHIMKPGTASLHKLNPMARVEKKHITYPDANFNLLFTVL